MAKKFKCVLETWSGIHDLTKDIARQIIESGYEPDVIIGLTRGGWFPARGLCDLLGIKNLASLKVEHWGITANPDGKAKIKSDLGFNVKGKKVLMVDDIVDTGESFVVSKKHVEGLEPAELKTAALQLVKGAKFEPDYYSKEIEWSWRIYPWCLVEDVINLAGNLLEDGELTPEEISLALKEHYQIDVSVGSLHDILLEMKRRRAAEPDGNKWRKTK